MVVNKTCPYCLQKNTYYIGKGVFYCKICKVTFGKEQFPIEFIKEVKNENNKH
jgi:ribosomal protein L37AE/L43A